jgi:predicted transcriptional regulator
MNAQVKKQEYELLNEIAQDSLVTQASLSARLDIAVGSVNWYIKRLVNRGWVKVSHLDRTRLKYDLTRDGVQVLKQRALQYARDSLGIYKDFRRKAKAVAEELVDKGIECVYMEGSDEIMDILRLTCIEAGLSIEPTPGNVILGMEDQQYVVQIQEISGTEISGQGSS